ncbi:MAG: alpha/beta fold hydrolase BchO [Pseudomonadota bacterium]
MAALSPRWSVEGRGWPHASESRFVLAGGLRWHVQIFDVERAGGPRDGDVPRPDILLLHGLGAAGHSWRDVVPILAAHGRVIVPDLPAHGFTERPATRRLTLPRQARLMKALLSEIGVTPDLAVAHSAGAPIIARMALEGWPGLRAILAFNGAFAPFPGLAGQLFPALARGLSLNPVVPRFFSLGAIMDPASVGRLVRGTGSALDERGLELYRRLVSCPGHVSGAIAMMAAWQLEPLYAALPQLSVPLVLATGSGDRAVPPSDAETLAARVPGARVVPLGGLGHLAHEEAPDRAAALILETARRTGVLPANAVAAE